MQYMDANIEMRTEARGGLFSSLRRAFSGENFFLSRFRNVSQFKGNVAFSAPFPGAIQHIDLPAHNGSIICQRRAFLCATEDVQIDVVLNTRLGAGLFGGEGFVLQRMRGTGSAFINAGGTLIRKKLGYQEVMYVDTGCLAAFTEGVGFDIQRISGVRNVLFGGEGFFLARMTGPGLVYIQSLPIDRLAKLLAKYHRLVQPVETQVRRRY